MIYGFNNVIACEPFRAQSVETKSVGSAALQLRIITNKSALVPLVVVFGSEEHRVRVGDRVFVVQPGPNDQWAKTVEVDTGAGKREVVLVTLDRVQLVDRAPIPLPPLPKPTSVPGRGTISSP